MTQRGKRAAGALLFFAFLVAIAALVQRSPERKTVQAPDLRVKVGTDAGSKRRARVRSLIRRVDRAPATEVAPDATVASPAPVEEQQICGTVQVSDGRRIESARVALVENGSAEISPAVSTDANGRFCFQEASPGPFEISAWHRSYGTAPTRTAWPGEEEVQLVLPSPGSIDGTVVVAGETPSDLVVWVDRFSPLMASDAWSRAERFERFAWNGGAFQLNHLPAGTYDLAARAGGRVGVLRSVQVASGSSTSGVVISLDAGASITGVVLSDVTGLPLKGASVRLLYARDSVFSTTTDPSGRFTIDGISPRQRVLSVHHPGFVGRMIAVELSDQPTQLIEVRLTPSSDPSRVQYVGIGATLQEGASGITIAGLMPDGPAERMGLVAGDRIIRVDGTEVRPLGSSRTVEMIQGPQDKIVVLDVLRDGQPMQIAIRREPVRYRIGARAR